jgi:hypothetical protein
MRRITTSLTAIVLTACGVEPRPVSAPTATTPAPPTAHPSSTAVATGSAPPPAEDLPDLLKPAKVKFIGTFVQDFSGEYRTRAEAAARKAAGPNDRDGERYRAALEKARRDVEDVILELRKGREMVWMVKGKVIDQIPFEVVSRDHPAEMEISFHVGPQSMRTRSLRIEVFFIDDDTFSMKDPRQKDPMAAATLVFKRRR